MPLPATESPRAATETKARAEIDIGTCGVKSLEIEAEDLAAGDYEFLIGDTVRGTLTLSGGTGHLRFKAEPDDPNEILLDFAAAGLPVSIRQGETVFFSGTLPAQP